MGAALSQVAGNVDTLVNLLHTSREEAIETAIQQAKEAAVAVGAKRDTLKVTLGNRTLYSLNVFFVFLCFFLLIYYF